jgi:hypothetical protein
MFIAPPPVNYWQCVVVDQSGNVLVDQNRNLLLAQSPSNFIAYSQVKTQCQQDTIGFCNTAAITCRFNGAIQLQSCTARNDLGQRFTAQMNYQPCARAMALCLQQLNVNQQYNLHCYIVG